MATLVSNPNTLTKDRLKAVLQEHNITLPSPSSKKDVYVQLYKTHLLTNKDPLGFSSDDEVVLPSPKRKVNIYNLMYYGAFFSQEHDLLFVITD